MISRYLYFLKNYSAAPWAASLGWKLYKGLHVYPRTASARLSLRYRHCMVMIVGCLLHLGSAAWAFAKDHVPEIAISLDDAPMPSTVIFKGTARTHAILQQLRAVSSPPVGIFAVGVHAQHAGGLRRLKMYAEAGHFIANHTYSHYKLGQVPAATFIQDIQKAHQQLCGLPNFRPWFRFPYLYEGDNVPQRKAVLEALATMGYQQGYVTVCNYDFYINHLVVQAIKKGQQVAYDRLKTVYLTILWDCIDFYDKLAHQVLGRSVKQVLLLHANDLAALYLGDLLELIRSKGWKVISIEEAYKDAMAHMTLTTPLSSQSRIAAIAREKGLTQLVKPHPSQTYTYIQQALEQAQVFTWPIPAPVSKQR